MLHGGRPKHEEPHVKKIKKRTYEKTEYILRVDLESLGINEDDFEDLQSLFEVDNVLNYSFTVTSSGCSLTQIWAQKAEIDIII